MKTAFLTILISFLLYACHRKAVPAATPPPSPKVISIKPAEKKRPVPKVIIVNDLAATKTPDGRLYYDLDGHRYWKNFKDGKYYIYRKGINADSDFKPVSSN